MPAHAAEFLARETSGEHVMVGDVLHKGQSVLGQNCSHASHCQTEVRCVLRDGGCMVRDEGCMVRDGGCIMRNVVYGEGCGACDVRRK